MSKAVRYFTEVWEELGKVTWPTRQEAVRMTLTVIIVSAVIAVFIGGLDIILTNFISRVLTL
jgi:preprotein translocase subunit SecE